jgi:hypothetical protein
MFDTSWTRKVNYNYASGFLKALFGLNLLFPSRPVGRPRGRRDHPRCLRQLRKRYK